MIITLETFDGIIIWHVVKGLYTDLWISTCSSFLRNQSVIIALSSSYMGNAWLHKISTVYSV